MSEEEERALARFQVEEFIEVMKTHYGITPQDVVETVRFVRERRTMAKDIDESVAWVMQRRTFYEKLQNGTAIFILVTVIGAFFAFVVEGFRHYIK